MKALRWHGRRDVRLDEVDDPPPPAAGQVTIDVSWTGICGTDLEEYLAGPLIIPVGEPNPLTGRAAPITLGHEVAGRVSRVGQDVTALREGDLVALDGLIWCGECFWCRRHLVNLCRNFASIGLSADGGLAERLTVGAGMCVPVPDRVPDEQVALAEPVSVAVRAFRRGRIALGDRVTILGGGTIGQALLMVARSSGAAEVVVVDPVPFRRDLALKLGASSVQEPGPGLGETLLDEQGVGPDLVVDATGIPAAPATAVGLVRSGGRVVIVGLPPERTSIDMLDLVLREVDLMGSLSHVYDEDFRTAVALIADGRVDVAPLITHRIPLDRVVEDGFGTLTGDQRGSALKILVSPRGI